MKNLKLTLGRYPKKHRPVCEQQAYRNGLFSRKMTPGMLKKLSRPIPILLDLKILILLWLITMPILVTGCQLGIQSVPMREPLPNSAKGYELYSWQDGSDGWQYTLISGSNRQKTAAEITDGVDAIDPEGWVKQSASSREALYDLLARLPAGAAIYWRGALASPEGAEPGQFRLPGDQVVQDIEARSRELGLQLILIADELEAILVLPETVAAGDPVPLTFNLLNHADYPLYLLDWYTPLEGIAGEIFHVTRDGQKLPYQGILALRGNPGRENYRLLLPKTAVKATVDLAEAYDFSRPGTYNITFISPRISDVARSEAEMAQAVEDLGPVTIVSNSATVTVLP